MNEPFCARETDVLELVAIGQWPRQADADLLTHVAECASCTDAVIVSLAMGDAMSVANDVVAPDATAVWQRAQWQARQDAMRVASRPVMAAQALAAVGLLAAIGAGVMWLANLAPRPAVMADSAADRATSLWSRLAELWLPMIDAVRELPTGSAWLASGVIGGVLLVIGLAFLLSTLADFASDPPAQR